MNDNYFHISIKIQKRTDFVFKFNIYEKKMSKTKLKSNKQTDRQTIKSINTLPLVLTSLSALARSASRETKSSAVTVSRLFMCLLCIVRQSTRWVAFNAAWNGVFI